MERKFDLCAGRDYQGRRWYTLLPAGVVKTGMFVRLLGGTFILVDRVEQGGRMPGGSACSTAVQVLDGIWEGRCRG